MQDEEGQHTDTSRKELFFLSPLETKYLLRDEEGQSAVVLLKEYKKEKKKV